MSTEGTIVPRELKIQVYEYQESKNWADEVVFGSNPTDQKPFIHPVSKAHQHEKLANDRKIHQGSIQSQSGSKGHK